MCRCVISWCCLCRYVTPSEPKPSTVYFYITPLDQHTCRVFSHALVCDPLPKPVSWLLSKRPRWLDHLVLNQARHGALPVCVLGFRTHCIKLTQQLWLRHGVSCNIFALRGGFLIAISRHEGYGATEPARCGALLKYLILGMSMLNTVVFSDLP